MIDSLDTKAAYFTALDVENVRCFGERQSLDLTARNGCPARWTLILGDNGVGKTTLLQCLAWMRFSPAIGDGADEPSKPPLFAEDDKLLQSLLRSGAPRELHLGVTMKNERRLGAVDDAEQCDAAKLETKVQLRFDESRMLLTANAIGQPPPESIKEVVEPLVVAYGATRHVGFHNLSADYMRDPIASRLAAMTELYDVEDILSDLDYAAKTYKEGSKEHERLRQLRAILARILPEDISPDAIIIFPPDVLDRGQPSGVCVQLFSGLVPLSALSLGYQTILAWTADLAWRLMRFYPDSDNPFHEPAIVLIDELDLHLHPKWQLRIIDDLSVVFPRTQFIATSHSPLLVQVADTANFALLRKSGAGVEIVNEPDIVRGWRVDQILSSELFDLPQSRSKRVARLLLRRDELLERAERSHDEETELAVLRSEIDALPTADDPRDQEAMDLIRKAAGLLVREGVAPE